MVKLFVYGTLKKGFQNHRILEGCALIQGSKVSGRLFFCGHRSFPYARVATGWQVGKEPTITGEIYEVPQELVERLDHLEGVPDHYERVETRTTSGILVQIYVASDDTMDDCSWLEEIPHGVYTLS